MDMNIKTTLQKIKAFITEPIRHEPVFFCLIPLFMFFSHFLYELPEEYASFFHYRNLLIFLSNSVFMSWLLSILIYWTHSKLLKILAYSVMIFLMAVDLFLYFNFQTIMSPWILLLLKETNIQESSEFLEHYLFTDDSIICYVIVGAAIVLTCILERINRKRLSLSRWAQWTTCLILVCFFVIGAYIFSWTARLPLLSSQIELDEWDGRHGGFARRNTPTNLLFSTLFLHASSQEHEYAIQSCFSALNHQATCSEKDSLNVIFIIGESFNKYHCPLYGYPINTTPHLCQEKEKGNLHVFTDAIAPYNLTSYAVKNICSTNSIADHETWFTKPSFMMLFKQAGFYVSLWSNQRIDSDLSSHDYALNSYLYDTRLIPLLYNEYNTKSFTYDLRMVQRFQQYRAKHPRQSHPLNLYVFHLLGQHSNAINRFPHESQYLYFSADSIKRPDIDESQRQTIADYDNATRYNDKVIKSIMDYFHNTSAILVYLSDHGEEVYDYRNYVGRSHEAKKSKEALRYQFEIPCFVWYSNRYEASHPEIVSAIKAAVDKPMSSDDISHTLLNMASIHTPYYHNNRDVLSDQFVVKPRIVQGKIDYDKQIR